MGWPKGKLRKLKLVDQEPPSTPADKPKKKEWSGIWVEDATVHRDPDGGVYTVAKIKTNLSDEIDKLHGLSRAFDSVNVQAADGSPIATSIESYGLKIGKKRGSQVATITVKAHGNFSKIVSRQVTVDGAQKSLPMGEEMGEPR
jgi:hypothetical protein